MSSVDIIIKIIAAVVVCAVILWLCDTRKYDQ